MIYIAKEIKHNISESCRKAVSFLKTKSVFLKTSMFLTVCLCICKFITKAEKKAEINIKAEKAYKKLAKHLEIACNKLKKASLLELAKEFETYCRKFEKSDPGQENPFKNPEDPCKTIATIVEDKVLGNTPQPYSISSVEQREEDTPRFEVKFFVDTKLNSANLSFDNHQDPIENEEFKACIESHIYAATEVLGEYCTKNNKNLMAKETTAESIIITENYYWAVKEDFLGVATPFPSLFIYIDTEQKPL